MSDPENPTNWMNRGHSGDIIRHRPSDSLRCGQGSSPKPSHREGLPGRWLGTLGAPAVLEPSVVENQKPPCLLSFLEQTTQISRI